ncbi:MAG: DUF3842 family protein [Nitrospirae bacterium]|nr:DUF3842 family protein [Nitrospirota bacterium]
MTVVVIDGQGGGIGAHIIEKMRKNLPEALLEKIDIIAIGTNAIATSSMMKAGANKAATGENSIVHVCRSADMIIGSWAILIPNSMLGELTPVMAEAVATSKARKFLVPLPQQGIELIGVMPEPFPHLIDKLIDRLKGML